MPVAPMVVAPAVDESTFEMTSPNRLWRSLRFKVRLSSRFLQLFQREVFVLRRQRRLRRATTSGRSTTIQIRTLYWRVHVSRHKANLLRRWYSRGDALEFSPSLQRVRDNRHAFHERVHVHNRHALFVFFLFSTLDRF